MTGVESKSLTPSEMEILNYCDAMNERSGRELVTWFRITSDPDDLGIYVRRSQKPIVGFPGIYGLLGGQQIRVGKEYRITYSSPVRLPFMDPEEGVVILHVAEIEGTLSEPLALADVRCVVCQPDNYSIQTEVSAEKSVFRFFEGDQLLEVLEVKENGGD